MKRLNIALVVLACALGGPAVAADSRKGADAGSMPDSLGPLDVVRPSLSRVLETVQSQAERVNGSEDRQAEIRRIATHLFDFDDMARRALGQHWKDLSPAEQGEFVRRFADVLKQAFVMIVERCSGESVAFVSAEVSGDYAHVRSRTTRNQGAGISIDYRLVNRGSRWAVYDIVFDGVSLVANYRSQFNALIGTGSSAQALEEMRTPATRTQSRGAVVSVGANHLEPSIRERLAAGLLLGAALYGRQR